MRELEEKSESLEREIILENAKNSSKLTREMIIDYYKEALRQEPLMLITLLVKEITLFNDKMVIQFNTPTETSPDESRGFDLYSDNVKYPVYIMKKKIPVMIDFELIIKV